MTYELRYSGHVQLFDERGPTAGYVDGLALSLDPSGLQMPRLEPAPTYQYNMGGEGPHVDFDLISPVLVNKIVGQAAAAQDGTASLSMQGKALGRVDLYGGIALRDFHPHTQLIHEVQVQVTDVNGGATLWLRGTLDAPRARFELSNKPATRYEVRIVLPADCFGGLGLFYPRGTG